jgi:hypothetical protein
LPLDDERMTLSRRGNTARRALPPAAGSLASFMLRACGAA